jgi:hypothetical protein
MEEFATDTNESFSHSQSSFSSSGKSSLRRMVKKEYQNKDNNALKSQSDHKPLKRRSKTGGRRGGDDNNNESSASLSMEEFVTDNNRSLASLGCSLRKSFRNILKPNNNDSSGVGRRERERRQCDWDDDKFISDQLQDDAHKPLKRRPKTGCRSRGSEDNDNDSCASLSMDEFVTDNNRSLSSLGSNVRKSFRNILKPSSNDSFGAGRRERERKQYNFGDDESFSDRLHDDDSNIHDHIDQDRLMVILCKELEITCDDDG